MSKMNDFFVQWIGPNWKTTFGGISSEMLALGMAVGTLTAIFGSENHKVIGAVVMIAAAVLKSIARILVWIAAADASPEQKQQEKAP